MAANNIYDSIIAELIYLVGAINSSTSAYIEIVSDQPLNGEVPFDFSGNVVFTATVKNIPTGYSVKANSFIITESSTTTGSSNPLSTSAVSVTFTTIGDTFNVTATVTLESLTGPNIVLNKAFVLTGSASIFAGSKATNNTFTTAGLDSYVYKEQATKVDMGGTLVYPYIVVPASSTQPIYFRDENENVIPLSSFTMTLASGLNYYVLNWATTFNPTSGLKWTLEY